MRFSIRGAHNLSLPPVSMRLQVPKNNLKRLYGWTLDPGGTQNALGYPDGNFQLVSWEGSILQTDFFLKIFILYASTTVSMRV